MRKERFDRKATKAVMKVLDTAVHKHGMEIVRHAANKWVNAQRTRISLGKAKEALEKRLEEVKHKLS